MLNRRVDLLNRRRAGDAGFTLIELLVSVSILGLIALPLGNVMIGFLRNSNDTTGRLAESHDAQISAAYFAQDVASLGARDWTDTVTPYAYLQSVELAAPSTGGLYPCGTASLPDAVIRLAWDDYPNGADAAPVQTRAAYLIETVGGRQQLHRITCAGNATPVTDVVLAHDLVSASAACATSCTGTGTALPRRITLSLTIADPASAPGSSYSVTLTGDRRQT
ncbi:MAG TPA: type II secretion system protein [Jatrophihabitans sp.]|nr:type II secretion system protein [Jatrophihabitans sp.]